MLLALASADPTWGTRGGFTLGQGTSGSIRGGAHLIDPSGLVTADVRVNTALSGRLDLVFDAGAGFLFGDGPRLALDAGARYAVVRGERWSFALEGTFGGASTVAIVPLVAATATTRVVRLVGSALRVDVQALFSVLAGRHELIFGVEAQLLGFFAGESLFATGVMFAVDFALGDYVKLLLGLRAMVRPGWLSAFLLPGTITTSITPAFFVQLSFH